VNGNSAAPPEDAMTTIRPQTTLFPTIAPQRSEPRAATTAAVVPPHASAMTFPDRFDAKQAVHRPQLNATTGGDTTVQAATTKTQAEEKKYPPVPPEWKYPGGGYRTSSRDLSGLLERGFKEGGYAQGLRWLQEALGLKVDGKFGRETAKALAEEPVLLNQLREQRIAETKNATPLTPMSAAQKESLKTELTKVYDANMAKNDNRSDLSYEQAVIALQTRMVRSGEPMIIDGKLGKATYQSMVRLYGRKTADELSLFVKDLQSRGVD
jgi:hypothetical protein